MAIMVADRKRTPNERPAMTNATEIKIENIPATFSLRGFPTRVFRVADASYYGFVLLEVLTNGSWLHFCRATREELVADVMPLR